MSRTPSARRPARSTPRPARRFALTLLATALAATLGACGGGDDDDGPGGAHVTVSPSLGAVFNADVRLTCAATSALLASASTGSTGVASMTTGADCDGPVLIQVSARSDGSSTYYDEASGTTLSLPAGSMLRAVTASVSAAADVGVTALTEIATRQALAAAGGNLSALTAAQVNAANGAVAPQLLGTPLDILSRPTLWTASTPSASLGTRAADRYAFYLAALASMASGEARPALAMLHALATDLADGSLDGGSSGGFSYSGSGDLATQLQAGLQAMKAYADASLQGDLGLSTGPVSLNSFSPASGAVGDTITLTGTGFDPDPFHMQVKFSNNIAAEVLASSATSVTVKVPAGAVSGPITITHSLSGQSDTSDTAFTVTGGGGGSGDGWVSRASPSGFLLNGLAYGNGRFVAVGFGRALMTSSDGLSWTSGTAPDSNYYDTKSVIWTGNQFVMVGDKTYGSSSPALIATSSDGITWTRRSWTPSINTETLVDVGVGGGKITAVGMNGTVVSSSDGGLSWAEENAGGHVAAFTGVAGNDSVRVAVGRDGAYDGVILYDTGSGWARVTGLSGFVARDVAWMGGQFIAVGATSAGLSNAAIATSTDGVSWTRRILADTEAPANFPLLAVLAQGDTLYATADNAGNQHLILKSVDAGASWTVVHQAQVSGIAMLAGIATSGSRIVTVGGVKSVTLP